MASDTPFPEAPPTHVVLPCGWGRLIFAHTFSHPGGVADELLREEPGTRDIAFYVTDPHLILNTAPRDLFMDPSDTYRLDFRDYQPDGNGGEALTIGPFTSPAQIEAANRIYLAQKMVPIDAAEVWANRRDRRLQFFAATSVRTGDVLGVALGVDHKLAFGDIENGASIWSLAVDPQATRPGVGAALVRHVVEFFRKRGRRQLDLSVLHDNTEAIRLYERLGFRRVPVFAIKRCNPINEKLFVGPAVPAGFNPYAMIIINEALRRGIGVEPLSPEQGYFRLTLGGRSITCRESLSDLTSAVTMSLADNKAMTRRVMEAAGISLPTQQEAASPEDNRAFLARHGRVVVKPARGEQGQGVAVNLSKPAEVERAVEKARAFCDQVLLEEFVSGLDLRIVVINYEVVAAAVRRPPEITGTGRHTVRQLIESTSRRRAAATGGESRIPVDAETRRCLREAGLTLGSVLEQDRTVRVRNAANLHTGGTIHDVTEKLHPALAAAAVEAARALQIPVTGLDFIVPSVERETYWFIEANERPGLANHEPRPTAERFVDLLFPTTARTRPERLAA
jgi:GNAT-family acetyltransferase (TIGR03103 family)